MILCYTYEADYHCIECAQKRFKTDTDTNIDENSIPFDAEDYEGNAIYAVSTWEETSASLPLEGGGHSLVCGDCYKIIRKHYMMED